MIRLLRLENIAVFERVSVPFGPGLTILTGEAGSGKSLLIDALGWAFGAPVSARDILRTGTSSGRVELTLAIPSAVNATDEDGEDDAVLAENALAQVRTFLEENGIELAPDETELLISREFTAASSRSRINGTPVNRQLLETLRGWLLEIQGQHALTGLFRKSVQRENLDALGGSDMAVLRAEVAEVYQGWLATRQHIQTIEENRQQRLQRLDFVRFQLQELEEAELSDPDEDAQVRQELQRLQNAESLLQGAAKTLALMGGDDSGYGEDAACVETLLAKALKSFQDPARLDGTAGPLNERLISLLEETKALVSDLARYHDRLEVRPDKIQELGDRLDRLERLKRKYGPTLADVLATRDQLANESDTLDQDDRTLEALKATLNQQEAAMKSLLGRLTAERKTLSAQLETRMTSLLRELAMPSARFAVQLLATDWGPLGAEEVEFLFSANPGEDLRPLAKIASGGELSRVLLALTALMAHEGQARTYVFDEIDTGTSGATAQSIAAQLFRLSRSGCQVIVVTHQPIVAAAADQHLHVSKRVIAGADEGLERASTQVAILNDESTRLEVLSRLASGLEGSDEAVASYASRLLKMAEDWKLTAVSGGVATLLPPR